MLKVNSFFNTIFSRSEKKKLAEFQRTVQLINEMKRRKQKIGAVTMCVGTGQGACGIFELLN